MLFPRDFCTDVSDCCDSGLSDDFCVLKTGYCWVVNPYGNGTLVFSDDGGVMDCSTANECVRMMLTVQATTILCLEGQFLV